jgi:hypothetical protein
MSLKIGIVLRLETLLSLVWFAPEGREVFWI